MTALLLSVKNLRKSFPETGEILRGIDLEVEKGEIISVIGPSGGGKTTLLRCLNFLETPDSGEMTFEGETYNLSSIGKKQINGIRKRTAFVFQNFNLFANKTAVQNVMEGLLASGMGKKDARRKAEQALADVNLSDRLDYYPNQLSGGQQQRVAIARAVALDPDIIYFDEPTSALDPELTREVLDVIAALAGQSMTMIVVTHELEFARRISTKVMLMDEGIIAESAGAEKFFNSPESERTKQFLEKINS